MDLLLQHISQLVTVPAHGRRFKAGDEMRNLGIIENAALYCRDGMIAWVGPMAEWTGQVTDDAVVLNAQGMVALPGFVDSHTHMTFAGDRAHEFAQRTQGATYQEIAEQGGGILSTIRHVRAASKRELKRRTARYLVDMMKNGTTTVEVKSGYGLSLDAEIKMLEAITEIADEEMMTVVPTFLGAHAVPPEFRDNPSAYVRVVLDKMIPYVGKKKLAVFCDVFCEKGYFSPEESEAILAEGRKWGLLPKVHAEELGASGGVDVAAHVNAVSADHLEHITPAGADALRDAGVVGTVLPGVSFFLNHGYAPARMLIERNVPVAIASDFNPGSCMSFSMPLMMTIACTHMKMTPEEALTAATLNGAAALGLSDTLGSIEVGKKADVIVADVPDYTFLAYHFGANHVKHVIKGGVLLEL